MAECCSPEEQRRGELSIFDLRCSIRVPLRRIFQMAKRTTRLNRKSAIENRQLSRLIQPPLHILGRIVQCLLG